MITVRVLCVFHNNECRYSWHAFMYNLSNTKLLLLVVSCHSNNWLVTQLLSTFTVLCKAFNMYLWQVSLADNSRSLIGHLSVTFGRAPDFDVADSLDAAYLGPFINLLFLLQFSRRNLIPDGRGHVVIVTLNSETHSSPKWHENIRFLLRKVSEGLLVFIWAIKEWRLPFSFTDLCCRFQPVASVGLIRLQAMEYMQFTKKEIMEFSLNGREIQWI